MIKMPEEPEKFIYYCIVLLPGFLTLALILHVTEHQLSEFAFTYTAVTLSVALYVVVDAILAAWRRFSTWRSLGAGSVNAGTHSLIAQISVTAVTAIIVALVTINAVQSDHLLHLARWIAPFPVDRLGASEPLVHLVRNEPRMHEIDERPTDVMINQAFDAQSRKCKRAPYSMFARVTADSKTYEGRISYYNGSRGKQGIPFLLSPACRVLDGPPEQVEVIPGPGVVIFDAELKRVEFLEMYGSACWRLLNPGAPLPVKCPKNP